LPWFAQPWFWIPGLILVSLVFAKDVMGPAVPTALKKPFDLVEFFENKISALIAVGAFVPLIATLFSSGPGDDAGVPTLGLAMVNWGALLNMITLPLAILVFLLVWMVANVVNVLVLISPFAVVDAALKSARLFLLGTVAASALADPYVGAAWSVVIILVAYLLAGWSFRLTVFGWVFAWDLLTLRCQRFTPGPAGNWLFTARTMDQVPVRTYGQLVRDEQG
jgi:hypothetical protein